MFAISSGVLSALPKLLFVYNRCSLQRSSLHGLLTRNFILYVYSLEDLWCEYNSFFFYNNFLFDNYEETCNRLLNKLHWYVHNYVTCYVDIVELQNQII